MANTDCSCELCKGGGLGLLGEGSGVYSDAYRSTSSSSGSGDIYVDYADYFEYYGEITGLNGMNQKRKLVLRPGRPTVSEEAGYVPPVLRKNFGVEPSPFYKKYDSGTSDIYAYRGRKIGIAKAFENTRVPKSDKLAPPYVAGYDMRKRYIRRKFLRGLFISLAPLALVIASVITLFVNM